MINVADIEWTVPVAARALFQFPEKRLHLIGSAAALPFLCLFGARALMDRRGKCLQARRRNVLALASKLQRYPRRKHGFPFWPFVVFLDVLVHQRSRHNQLISAEDLTR